MGLDAYLRFRAEFAEAMDRRFYTPEWLDEKVATGAFKVFGDDAAAMIVKLVDYPTGLRAVKCVYAAGDVRRIKELGRMAEEWGAENGASFARVASREAWQRLLPDYTTYKVDLMKELCGG